MNTYVFLYRFKDDTLSMYRVSKVRSFSAASAHAGFYEEVGAEMQLKNGAFSLMAEESLLGSVIFIPDEVIIKDKESITCL